jgi:ribosomal protein L17
MKKLYSGERVRERVGGYMRVSVCDFRVFDKVQITRSINWK